MRGKNPGLLALPAIAISAAVAVVLWLAVPGTIAKQQSQLNTAVPVMQDAQGSLTSQKIEQIAVTAAGKHGLQGPPTSVVSKQMPRAEAHARLDLFIQKRPDDTTTQVWLVWIRGKVVLTGHSPVAPRRDGSVPLIEYDNIWELLDANGHEFAYGALPNGTALNLNSPVTGPAPYPTPASPK